MVEEAASASSRVCKLPAVSICDMWYAMAYAFTMREQSCRMVQ